MRTASATIALALLVGCGTAESPVGATELDHVQGTLVVANKRGNSLSRIDLASGNETHRVRACENPHELAVSPNRSHVVVACYSGETLEIFETAALRKVAEITLDEGARPHGVVWHSNGSIVASAEGRGSIFVIEAALSDEPKVREIGSGAPGPHMVVLDASGEAAWGTIIPTGTVVRYDLVTGTEAARRELGGQTEGIALAPNGSALWVGANQAGKIYRLDPVTLEVRAEIESGPIPIRVAAHPGGRWVVSSNMGEGGLSVIDTAANAVARSISVSGSQERGQVTLVFSCDGSRLYAAETMNDTIAEINFASGRVLRRLEAGEGSDGLAVLE
jgi:DNA-binding beta-propeller fold protein YncE